MIIYFSKASSGDMDFFGTEGMFRVGDEYYYNGVEFGTNPGGMEEVRIFDTCNRSIPVSLETIPQLVEALQHCYNTHEEITRAQKQESRIYSSAEAVVRVEDETDWCYINHVTKE